jgi:hypothetical protein
VIGLVLAKNCAQRYQVRAERDPRVGPGAGTTDAFEERVDGVIQVPLEAVGPLTTVGGFVLAKNSDNAISAGVRDFEH